jgi:hypothetical protein
MKTPDLEGAGAKLDRAREHVVSQKAETDDIVVHGRGNPFETVAQTDPKTNRVTIVVTEVQEFSPLASTIVGDALHNFRSVLDHIAWLLVKRGTQPNLSARDKRQGEL